MPYQVDGASSALQKSVLKDDKGCINSSEMFQLQEWFSIILWLCTLYLKFLHFIVSIFNIIFWFTVCFNNIYVFLWFYLLDGPITKLAHFEDRIKEINYTSVFSVHVPISITKMEKLETISVFQYPGGLEIVSSQDMHFLPIRWWGRANSFLSSPAASVMFPSNE